MVLRPVVAMLDDEGHVVGDLQRVRSVGGCVLVSRRRFTAGCVAMAALMVSGCGGHASGLPKHGKGLGITTADAAHAGVSLGRQFADQPRVAGTACRGGFDGGEYLIVGSKTSCALARAVGHAVLQAGGRVNQDQTVHLTDPNTATRVSLRCGYVDRAGPEKCSGAGGLLLYLFAAHPPLASK